MSVHRLDTAGRESAPRPWLPLLADAVLVGTVAALLCTFAWVKQGVLAEMNRRSAGLAVHAVLRAPVKEEQARELAADLEVGTPGLQARVISEPEARGLLALQEPWMQNLPEVELPRLPLLVEILHPAPLDRPGTLPTYNRELELRPEVEFVVFNDAGYESLVGFSRNLRWYAGALHSAFSALLLLLVVLVGLRLPPRFGRLIPATVYSGLAAATGAACGYLFLRVLATRAEGYYALSPLTIRDAAWPLMALVVTWIVCRCMVTAWRFRR